MGRRAGIAVRARTRSLVQHRRKPARQLLEIGGTALRALGLGVETGDEQLALNPARLAFIIENRHKTILSLDSSHPVNLHCSPPFFQPEPFTFSKCGHTRKVTIGKDAYLGMNVCVLYSADVGQGSVIGSGSVVVKSIPPYSVAVGNPAKVIRKRGK